MYKAFSPTRQRWDSVSFQLGSTSSTFYIHPGRKKDAFETSKMPEDKDEFEELLQRGDNFNDSIEAD